MHTGPNNDHHATCYRTYHAYSFSHPRNPSLSKCKNYGETAPNIPLNEFFVRKSQLSLTCPETQNTPSPHVRGKAVSTVAWAEP